MTRGVSMNVAARIAGSVTLGLVLGLPAAAAAQPAGPARDRIRQNQISTMERVLEGAVQQGVNNLRERVRLIMPGDVLIQDTRPEVRGFPLEGFGVFFDVEVPALRQSLAWTLQQMNQSSAVLAQDLAQLRRLMAEVQDPRAQAQFERVMQSIQRQIGPVAPAPAVAERQAPPPVAGQIAQGAIAPQSVPSAVAASVPLPQADPQMVLDPDEAYTEEVKDALIGAMISYGTTLSIGADEWLTVAARDNAPVNPLVQSDADFRTIIFRVKGSDLLEYQTQRLTLDEVRARVTIQEF